MYLRLNELAAVVRTKEPEGYTLMLAKLKEEGSNFPIAIAPEIANPQEPGRVITKPGK